jgi:hypothetical protein
MDPVFYDNYNSFEKSIILKNEVKNVLIKKINSNNFGYKNLDGINFE